MENRMDNQNYSSDNYSEIMYENDNLDLVSPMDSELVLDGFIMNDVFNLLPDANLSEDTTEADLKYSTPEFVPFSPRGPPQRENFQGEANFEIEIDASLTEKKKYSFSHMLQRIYVNMNCNFSVNFKWDATKFQGDMYVRATVVFSDADQAEKKVERCYQHSHEGNTAGMSAAVVRNVLRSGREFGAADVAYCGGAGPDRWHSVLVRARAPLTHAYHFVCKNSCSSGINRRAIDVVFTLEDPAGKVYGRRSIGARVCSCTKRDLLRDEGAAENTGKRPASAPAAERTKKIKLEVVDRQNRELITLPSIQIVGTPSAIAGVAVILAMQEEALAIKTASQLQVDDLNMCIPKIKKILEDLKSNKTI